MHTNLLGSGNAAARVAARMVGRSATSRCSGVRRAPLARGRPGLEGPLRGGPEYVGGRDDRRGEFRRLARTCSTRDQPVRAPGSPVRSRLLRGHWVLDQHATVAEAVAALRDARRVRSGTRPGTRLHLALEDARGDPPSWSRRGRLRIHHASEYQVVANDPPFAEQQANLRRYRPFGGDQPVPGGIESADRFVRASYFLTTCPSRVMWPRPSPGWSASRPCPARLAPLMRTSACTTRWVSAIDLTHLTYYFWSRTSPALIWLTFPHRPEPGCASPGL